MTSRSVFRRGILTSGPRTLNRVYFYTSSMDKFLQARRVFDQRGLIVDYFKSKTEPYEEDYEGTSQDLLRTALAEVTNQIGRGHLLFIEDTSVRLEALSGDGSDFPGLDVKDWFSRTSFAECDAAIRAAGGDRRATVKSDIALSLPGLDRPIFFHGETNGRLADGPPEFAENEQYPWLTPATFNGWFVPEGCDLPLGALPPDVAEELDFRGRAFKEMIDRVEEYTAALNLPASAYRLRKPINTDQPSLFSTDGDGAPALLVVGRTCAGKTTMAEHLSGHYGLQNIEASAIVRSLPIEKEDTDDPGGLSFARRALSELGHDIVAKEIVDHFGSDLERPFVVSGLRDVEEVMFMRQAVPRCLVVLVDSSERIRFDRHVRRRRPGAEQSLNEFRDRDLSQNEFGLLAVVEDLADVRILNEGSMTDFHEQIGALMTQLVKPGSLRPNGPRHGPSEHQLFRCLSLLSAEGGPLQCDEIERRSQQGGGSRIRHNNANKVLRAVPSLAERMDSGAGEDAERVRYSISARGEVYLHLMHERPGYRGVVDD